MTLLADKTALITGASAGIGGACARLLAKEGCRLVLLARRRDRLAKLASELEEEYGTEIYFEALDVRDHQAINTLPQRIPEKLREVDILINNAGLALGLEKAYAYSASDIDVMIDTNIKGVLNFLRVFVPPMVERGQGHIVNISSIAGLEAYPGGGIYCGTKHFVTALTKSLRMDLVNTPLRVTTISPGLVKTEFSIVRFNGDREQAAKVYQGLEPLYAEDIAEAVLFALSRPPHVQIADMVIFPTSQASAYHVHRE